MSEETVILADYQQKGRGRGNNSWYSGNKLNILMSILLFPGIPVRNFFFLTEIVSLAIIDLLEEFGIRAEIKWPNDIYVNGKKIAGILIENVLSRDIIETSIVGIGLNVNEVVFPDNLPNPVSIKLLTGKECHIENLAMDLLNKLEIYRKELWAGNFKMLHRKYNLHLFQKNVPHQFSKDNTSFKASILHVEKNGEIMLETESGTKKYSFGEIEMRF